MSKRTPPGAVIAGFSLALILYTIQPSAAQHKVQPHVALPGINLAGAEFGKIGEALGHGYVYPSDDFFSRYAGLGFKLVRLPFKIERVQPIPEGSLEASELAEISRCVAAARSAGLTIVLDAHNYGRRDGARITKVDLADFWSRMAQRFEHDDHVAYGVMNEPEAFKPIEWRAIVDETVRSIRAVSPAQLIMVPGGGWTGAHDWVSNGNAAAFADFAEPHTMVEVHQYLDQDNSGMHPMEYTPGSGALRLKEVTAWARTKGVKLFLGEFGFALPAGEVEARALLQFMTDNSDVWGAYAYWAGGPWWSNYPFSAEPADGKENPQSSLLREYFRGSRR